MFLNSKTLSASEIQLRLGDRIELNVNTSTTVSCGNAEEVKCVPQCETRNSFGQCMEYGKDVCGINPSCAPVCLLRSSNSGDCLEYGTDLCSTGGVHSVSIKD